MHPVEFSVCPASAAPASVPAEDAVRPGAGFASRLSVVGNMAMEVCTRALDQIAPGRVLRLTWELSPVGLMLGTHGAGPCCSRSQRPDGDRCAGDDRTALSRVT